LQAPVLERDGGTATRGTATWNQSVAPFIRWCNLPLAARMIVNVAMKDGSPLGWGGATLFTAAQQLRAGALTLQLWPGSCTQAQAATVTCLVNRYGDEASTATLTLTLHSFEKPVVRIGAAGAALHPPAGGAATASASMPPPLLPLTQGAKQQLTAGFDGSVAVDYLAETATREDYAVAQDR
jgi:hypothetical protein